MREITKQEAHDLIAAGQAGWYATGANPPIPHKSQYVIETRGRFFLVSQGFTMEPKGLFRLPGTMQHEGGHRLAHGPVKVAFQVTFDEATEWGRLLAEEIRQAQDINLGVDIKTKYGGRKDPP